MFVVTAKASTYVYEFAHRPSFSKKPEWVEADHSEDLPYVFGAPFTGAMKDTSFAETDYLVSSVAMKYWATFARHGYVLMSDF